MEKCKGCGADRFDWEVPNPTQNHKVEPEGIIFTPSTLNDLEAWAGENLEDAISMAMKEYGISREDVYDDAFGQEIPGDTKIEVEDGGTTNVITEEKVSRSGRE